MAQQTGETGLGGVGEDVEEGGKGREEEEVSEGKVVLQGERKGRGVRDGRKAGKGGHCLKEE